MDSILRDFKNRKLIFVDLSIDKKHLCFRETEGSCFASIYDKPQVQQLINELQEIHDQMVD